MIKVLSNCFIISYMQPGFHNRFFKIFAQVPFPRPVTVRFTQKKSVTEVFKQLLSRAGRQADKEKLSARMELFHRPPQMPKPLWGPGGWKGITGAGKKTTHPPPALADVLAGGNSGFPWAGRVLLELRHKSWGLMQVWLGGPPQLRRHTGGSGTVTVPTTASLVLLSAAWGPPRDSFAGSLVVCRPGNGAPLAPMWHIRMYLWKVLVVWMFITHRQIFWESKYTLAFFFGALH